MEYTVKTLKDNGLFIYELLAGSHLYNTFTENSDLDVRGLYNIPLEDWICNRYPTKIVVSTPTEDVTFMEIVKYLKLIGVGSPNLVDWLFVEGAEEKCNTPEMKYLIRVRDIFVTKKFLFRSYQMASKALMDAESKKGAYDKKIALAYRILITIEYAIMYENYLPIMNDVERKYILLIKDGEIDYKSNILDIKQGLQEVKQAIETATFPAEVSNKVLDDLILKFKLNGHKRL